MEQGQGLTFPLASLPPLLCTWWALPPIEAPPFLCNLDVDGSAPLPSDFSILRIPVRAWRHTDLWLLDSLLLTFLSPTKIPLTRIPDKSATPSPHSRSVLSFPPELRHEVPGECAWSLQLRYRRARDRPTLFN